MTCPTGKVPYPSVESARRHARVKTGSKVRVYQCHEGGGFHYHITTQSTKEGKRR